MGTAEASISGFSASSYTALDCYYVQLLDRLVLIEDDLSLQESLSECVLPLFQSLLYITDAQNVTNDSAPDARTVPVDTLTERRWIAVVNHILRRIRGVPAPGVMWVSLLDLIRVWDAPLRIHWDTFKTTKRIRPDHSLSRPNNIVPQEALEDPEELSETADRATYPPSWSERPGALIRNLLPLYLDIALQNLEAASELPLADLFDALAHLIRRFRTYRKIGVSGTACILMGRILQMLHTRETVKTRECNRKHMETTARIITDALESLEAKCALEMDDGAPPHTLKVCESEGSEPRACATSLALTLIEFFLFSSEMVPPPQQQPTANGRTLITEDITATLWKTQTSQSLIKTGKLSALVQHVLRWVSHSGSPSTLPLKESTTEARTVLQSSFPTGFAWTHFLVASHHRGRDVKQEAEAFMRSAHVTQARGMRSPIFVAYCLHLLSETPWTLPSGCGLPKPFVAEISLLARAGHHSFLRARIYPALHRALVLAVIDALKPETQGRRPPDILNSSMEGLPCWRLLVASRALCIASVDLQSSEILFETSQIELQLAIRAIETLESLSKTMLSSAEAVLFSGVVSEAVTFVRKQLLLVEGGLRPRGPTKESLRWAQHLEKLLDGVKVVLKLRGVEATQSLETLGRCAGFVLKALDHAAYLKAQTEELSTLSTLDSVSLGDFITTLTACLTKVRESTFLRQRLPEERRVLWDTIESVSSYKALISIPGKTECFHLVLAVLGPEDASVCVIGRFFALSTTQFSSDDEKHRFDALMSQSLPGAHTQRNVLMLKVIRLFGVSQNTLRKASGTAERHQNDAPVVLNDEKIRDLVWAEARTLGLTRNAVVELLCLCLNTSPESDGSTTAEQVAVFLSYVSSITSALQIQDQQPFLVHVEGQEVVSSSSIQCEVVATMVRYFEHYAQHEDLLGQALYLHSSLRTVREVFIVTLARVYWQHIRESQNSAVDPPYLLRSKTLAGVYGLLNVLGYAVQRDLLPLVRASVADIQGVVLRASKMPSGSKQFLQVLFFCEALGVSKGIEGDVCWRNLVHTNIMCTLRQQITTASLYTDTALPDGLNVFDFMAHKADTLLVPLFAEAPADEAFGQLRGSVLGTLKLLMMDKGSEAGTETYLSRNECAFWRWVDGLVQVLQEILPHHVQDVANDWAETRIWDLLDGIIHTWRNAGKTFWDQQSTTSVQRSLAIGRVVTRFLWRSRTSVTFENCLQCLRRKSFGDDVATAADTDSIRLMNLPCNVASLWLSWLALDVSHDLMETTENMQRTSDDAAFLISCLPSFTQIIVSAETPVVGAAAWNAYIVVCCMIYARRGHAKVVEALEKLERHCRAGAAVRSSNTAVVRNPALLLIERTLNDYTVQAQARCCLLLDLLSIGKTIKEPLSVLPLMRIVASNGALNMACYWESIDYIMDEPSITSTKDEKRRTLRKICGDPCLSQRTLHQLLTFTEHPNPIVRQATKVMCSTIRWPEPGFPKVSLDKNYATMFMDTLDFCIEVLQRETTESFPQLLHSRITEAVFQMLTKMLQKDVLMALDDPKGSTLEIYLTRLWLGATKYLSDVFTETSRLSFQTLTLNSQGLSEPTLKFIMELRGATLRLAAQPNNQNTLRSITEALSASAKKYQMTSGPCIDVLCGCVEAADTKAIRATAVPLCLVLLETTPFQSSAGVQSSTMFLPPMGTTRPRHELEDTTWLSTRSFQVLERVARILDAQTLTQLIPSLTRLLQTSSRHIRVRLIGFLKILLLFKKGLNNVPPRVVIPLLENLASILMTLYEDASKQQSYGEIVAQLSQLVSETKFLEIWNKRLLAPLDTHLSSSLVDVPVREGQRHGVGVAFLALLRLCPDAFRRDAPFTRAAIAWGFVFSASESETYKEWKELCNELEEEISDGRRLCLYAPVIANCLERVLVSPHRDDRLTGARAALEFFFRLRDTDVDTSYITQIFEAVRKGLTNFSATPAFEPLIRAFLVGMRLVTLTADLSENVSDLCTQVMAAIKKADVLLQTSMVKAIRELVLMKSILRDETVSKTVHSRSQDAAVTALIVSLLSFISDSVLRHGVSSQSNHRIAVAEFLNTWAYILAYLRMMNIKMPVTVKELPTSLLEDYLSASLRVQKSDPYHMSLAVFNSASVLLRPFPENALQYQQFQRTLLPVEQWTLLCHEAVELLKCCGNLTIGSCTEIHEGGPHTLPLSLAALRFLEPLLDLVLCESDVIRTGPRNLSVCQEPPQPSQHALYTDLIQLPKALDTLADIGILRQRHRNVTDTILCKLQRVQQCFINLH